MDDGLVLLRRAVDLEPINAAGRALVRDRSCQRPEVRRRGFVAAMQKALELGAPEAQVYQLAFQTSQRAGMWQRRLDESLVEGWIERAVAVAPEGTPARVRALAAKANWHDDVPAARAALEVAEELGGVELRFEGLGALQSALVQTGQLVEASEVAEIRTGSFPSISDPDQLADAQYMNAYLYANLGRDGRGARHGGTTGGHGRRPDPIIVCTVWGGG
jgi:hypothetical protein